MDSRTNAAATPLRQLTEDEVRSMDQQRTSTLRRLEALEAKIGSEPGTEGDTSARFDGIEQRLDALEKAVNSLTDAVTDDSGAVPPVSPVL